MKKVLAAAAVLCACTLAHADFTYTQTIRMTGGMLAGMAGRNGPRTNKISIKGQKMKTDDGNIATIIDLDAQTITTINNAQKTFAVKSFADLAAAGNSLNAKADVKETGQKKSVNGFNASETVMTMELEGPQGGKSQIEIDMWLSTEVPGADELRSFYAKNVDKFPWQSLGGGGNPGMASALAEVQKKIATLHASPVQQIVRIKAPGAMPGGAVPSASAAGPSTAQLSQMQAGMEKARTQLEALAAQGGPASAIAKQQLERMGPPPQAAGAAPDTGGWLLEMTIDSSGFSAAAVPDSAFMLPAEYRKQ
jgi:hypothetical protein